MSKKMKRVVAVIVIVLLGFVIFTFLQNAKFRITSTTIPGDTLPTSSSEILYTFNRELETLENQKEGFVELSDGVNYEALIEGDQLRIKLSTILSQDTIIDIRIDEIVSTEQETFSKDFNYTVAYVPFSELSKEEQKRQTEDTGQSNNSHPLLSQLPYDEIAFRIEYLIDEKAYGNERDWRNEKDNYAVVIKTFALSSGVSQKEYREKTLKLREAAKNWIAESDVDPVNDINIIYRPSDNELNGNSDAGD